MKDVEFEMFPKDLNPKRYIGFDFYSPDFADTIEKNFENIIERSTKILTNTLSDNSTSLSDWSYLGNEFVNMYSTAKNKLMSELDNRIKTEKNQTSYDLSTAKIDTTSTFVGSIYMPLSNSLTEEVNNSYDVETGVVSNALNQNKISNLLNMIPGSDITQKAISEIGKFTGTRTLLLNPDYVQTYKGTELRSFGLSWKVTPNNQQETESLLNIIRLFKKYSAPEKSAANALLLSPYFCTINLKNEILDDSIRLEEMLVQSVKVTYGGGNMEMFWDGAPKEYNIDINFVERRMKTLEDWDKKDEK